MLTLFLMAVLLPLGAQNQYISNSRCTTEDRFEDLGGDGGVILLSRHKDLVIALPNVKNKSIRFNGERPDGYYEFCVIIKEGETRTPKFEISRRGNVYKTEIVQRIQPNFLIAYKIEEVQNPIRTDEQTQANDAYMDASMAVLEFTTTIKDLKVDCHPQLGATIESNPSAADPSVTIITVKIPVASLSDALQHIEKLERGWVYLLGGHRFSVSRIQYSHIKERIACYMEGL